MRKTVIFDLDGTVLSINSFPLWASTVIRAGFPHLGPWRRAQIAFTATKALVARKASLISHETLKWRLQKLWQSAIQDDGGATERDLVARLRPFVRAELQSLLEAIAAGKIDAVLATAAVADYAENLGKALGFRHVLATPRYREAGEPSTVGVGKRDAVLKFLAAQGWQDRFLILFTDHDDDLPLIRLCQTVYWFGAEDERKALARDLPQISLRPGRRGGEVLRLSPGADAGTG